VLSINQEQCVTTGFKYKSIKELIVDDILSIGFKLHPELTLEVCPESSQVAET